MHSRSGYEIFIRLPLFSNFSYASRNEETPHLVVKCGYIYGDGNFIIIECKGHPYTFEHWYIASLWLEKTFGYKLLAKYFEKMLITNVDIALGVNLKLENYLFDNVWSQKTALFTSSLGEFETIYLQPHNKRLEMCIYNRLSKVRNRGILKVPREPSRIEFRIGKLKLTAEKFFNNPTELLEAFRRFRIYDLEKVKLSNILSEDQLIAISAIGLTPYLRKKNKYNREYLRKVLKPFLIPVINFEIIYKQWQKEITKMKVIQPFKKYDNVNGVDIQDDLRKEFIKKYTNNNMI